LVRGSSTGPSGGASLVRDRVGSSGVSGIGTASTTKDTKIREGLPPETCRSFVLFVAFVVEWKPVAEPTPV